MFSARLATLVLLAASGCTLNVEAASQEKFARYEGGGYSTFRLHAGSLDGGVHFHGWGSPTIDARAQVVALVSPGDEDRLDRARLDFRRSGSTLDLLLGALHDGNETYYYEWVDASVPEATDLDVETTTADVSIDGMEGRVRVQTDTGAIDVFTFGALDLRSDTGDIRALGGRGTVVTDTGDVDLQLLRAGFGDLRVETDTGDVTVRLPPGMGYVLDLESDTGEVRVTTDGLFVRDEDSLHAVVNGGGPLIRVVTDTGDIRITD